MKAEQRRQLVLAALAVVLAMVVYRSWPTTSPVSRPSSNQQKTSGTSGAATDRTRRNSTVEGAIDVHLEALEADRPKPGPTERNLFRFREKPPPPPPPSAGRSAPPELVAPVTPPESTGPPQPSPPPPINLKFIGIFGQAAGKPKIAILSDGSGPPLYGKEGDIVAGRYRILKIGEESIEMAYADGRGRQTIRLTGS